MGGGRDCHLIIPRPNAVPNHEGDSTLVPSLIAIHHHHRLRNIPCQLLLADAMHSLVAYAESVVQLRTTDLARQHCLQRGRAHTACKPFTEKFGRRRRRPRYKRLFDAAFPPARLAADMTSGHVPVECRYTLNPRQAPPVLTQNTRHHLCHRDQDRFGSFKGAIALCCSRIPATEHLYL